MWPGSMEVWLRRPPLSPQCLSWRKNLIGAIEIRWWKHENDVKIISIPEIINGWVSYSWKNWEKGKSLHCDQVRTGPTLEIKKDLLHFWLLTWTINITLNVPPFCLLLVPSSSIVPLSECSFITWSQMDTKWILSQRLHLKFNNCRVGFPREGCIYRVSPVHTMYM